MKTVAVGSLNPVKIEAVKLAFEAVWPNEEWRVSGVDVKSGVSDQPMSDLESIRGARTRAQKALEKTAADFGVGLEGGLQQVENNWFEVGWIVVRNKAGEEGIGSTLQAIVPPKMMEYVHQGMEVGRIGDMLFQTEESKQKSGHFGLMSNHILNRTEEHRRGAVSALARFIHPHLFEPQEIPHKITICGSIAFYDEMLAAEEKLKAQGFLVKLPPKEITDGEGKAMAVQSYYEVRKATSDPTSWVWETKAHAMHTHFDKVAWADSILVLNYTKHEIENYIGANTLMEMGLAFHLGKPIYLLNPIPEVAYKEEILGLKPVVLEGNIEQLHERLQQAVSATQKTAAL